MRDGEMVHAPTAGRALGIGADRIFDRFGEGKKRDESIRMPKDSLPAGHGRAALTCLGKAAIYDDQSTAKASDADVLVVVYGRLPEQVSAARPSPAGSESFGMRTDSSRSSPSPNRSKMRSAPIPRARPAAGA